MEGNGRECLGKGKKGGESKVERIAYSRRYRLTPGNLLVVERTMKRLCTYLAYEGLRRFFWEVKLFSM